MRLQKFVAMPVMVNLCVNLARPPGAQMQTNSDFGCFCEGVLRMTLTFKWIDRVKQTAFPNVGRSHPIN